LDNKDLRKMPFTVPEGYFANMPEKMQDRVLAKTPAKRRLVPYMALAASFLILLAAGTFLLRNGEKSETDIAGYYSEYTYTADDMTNEDIIAYLLWSGASVEEFGEYIEE